MMFINKNDSLRRVYDINRKPADVLFGKHKFALPMPAMGELICKTRDKHPDDYKDSLDEMCRLIDRGFLDVRFISNATDVYGMAKDLVREPQDSRDRISPMDALILATAVTDQDCESFYTTDSKLIYDARVHEITNDYRDSLGFKKMRVADISDLLKSH